MAALAASSTSVSAADMPAKAVKAPVVAPAASPFDIAFGGAVMSDYNFRGVSQSNRGASGGAYIEPQFTVPFGTLYLGVAAWAIDWPSAPAYGFSDPSAEIDFYGGWRGAFGAFSLDLGGIYYYYPKEKFGIDSDFFEIYAKASYAITPDLSIGGNVFYTPDLLNYGQFGFGDVSGVYASVTGKWVTPWKVGDLGSYISGELGHWFLDDVGIAPSVDPSYTYWNVGFALTYKVVTLDLRYHGTDMDRTECGNFLLVAAGNPATKWCGDTFIVSAKFDTALSQLK
jgi:uncharacterized protein (TIGR02001 family)